MINCYCSSVFLLTIILNLSWESPKSRLLKIQRHGHRHWTCPDMFFFAKTLAIFDVGLKLSPDMKNQKKTPKLDNIYRNITDI